MFASETVRNAAKFRESLPPILAFIKTQLEPARASEPEPLGATAIGLLDRVGCWLATMHRLDQTADFQAHMSGLRSLIELTVDLGLLLKNPSSHDMLVAWEVSARFKHGELFVAYASKHKTSWAPTAAAAFVAEHRDEVVSSRQQYWSGRHPSRWTGRDLRTDAMDVDSRFPKLGIEQLYEELYRYLCWQVHGSGLVALRSNDGGGVIASILMAFKVAAELGLAASEIAMRLLERWRPSDQTDLQRAREAWLLKFGELAALP